MPNRPAPTTTTSTDRGSSFSLRPCTSARLSYVLHELMTETTATASSLIFPHAPRSPRWQVWIAVSARPSTVDVVKKTPERRETVRSSARRRETAAATCVTEDEPIGTIAIGKSTAHRSASKAAPACATTAACVQRTTSTAGAMEGDIAASWDMSSSTMASATASVSSRKMATRKGVERSSGAAIGTGAFASRIIFVASFAPRTNDSNFFHPRSAVIATERAVEAKPQSVAAMTRAGLPTAWTKRRSRSAMTLGCSTRAAVVSMTPGTITWDE
mmetsp:Transcript_72309/g.120473  ORF Transcript_72309/g.120473 Transcript_72309/m.120473 type:complete len:273 (+) Transcript_72309:675-1493(+)